jgi:hypothetical protein
VPVELRIDASRKLNNGILSYRIIKRGTITSAPAARDARIAASILLTK